MHIPPKRYINTNSNENYNDICFRKVFEDDTGDKYDIWILVGHFNIIPKHEENTSGYLHVNNPNMWSFNERMIPLSNLNGMWCDKNHLTKL